MKIDNILNKIIIILFFILILTAIYYFLWEEEETQIQILTSAVTPTQIPTQILTLTQISTPALTPTPTTAQEQISSICIERIPGEWEYVNEICDPLINMTLIKNRSRQITINKTNGENECSFEPLANETIFETDIDKGFLNSNQKIQFRPNVLRLNILQTEKIKEPNNIKCKCDNPDLSENMYTEWSNWDKTCPDPTDYTKSASELLIFPTRTRRYKPDTNKLEGSACVFSEEVGIYCPRNCKGPDASLNTSYSDWDNTNWNKICPDPSNNILSESDYTIKQFRTRTYNSEIKELNGGKCSEADVKYTKEEVQIDCSRNCYGGDWNYSVCTAALCKKGDEETEKVKPGTRIKSWNGGIEAINGGKTCSIMHPTEVEDCSQKCNIDCKGAWTTSCDVTCGPGNYVYNITKNKENDGNPCPQRQNDRLPCKERNCPLYCADNWSPCTNVNGVDYQRNTLTPGNSEGKNDCTPDGTIRSCGAAKENDNIMFIRYPNDNGSNQDWKISTANWKSVQTEGGWGQEGWGEPSSGWFLVMHDNIRVDYNRFRYRWDNRGHIRPGSNFGGQNLCLSVNNSDQVLWIKSVDGADCVQFGWNERQIQAKIPGTRRHDYCLEPETDNNNSKMILRSCSGKTIMY